MYVTYRLVSRPHVLDYHLQNIHLYLSLIQENEFGYNSKTLTTVIQNSELITCYKFTFIINSGFRYYVKTGIPFLTFLSFFG